MYAIITTEEYKELLAKEKELSDYEDSILFLNKELSETKEMLDKLLLCITGGKTSTQWHDGRFEWVDIEDEGIIADYINENFIENKKLKLRSVNK